MTQNTLLPAGFYDRLETESGNRHFAIVQIMDVFAANGYAPISPPLIEASTEVTASQFSFTDPMSGKMLSLRSDITSQVSRIATTRLSQVQHPLRLCYYGDVLRPTQQTHDASRQFTQIGHEIIGTESVEADLEVVSVALEGLASAGISELCIDFTLPTLVKSLIKTELSLSPEDEKKLLHGLYKRDEKAITQICENKAALFTQLTDINLSLETLKTIPLVETITLWLNRLEALITRLSKRFPQVSFSLDVVDTRYFDYHQGIGFSIFAKGAKDELGRGGHYEIEKENETISAIGCSLYLDHFAALVKANHIREKKLVSPDLSLEERRKLQEQGFATVTKL